MYKIQTIMNNSNVELYWKTFKTLSAAKTTANRQSKKSYVSKSIVWMGGVGAVKEYETK